MALPKLFNRIIFHNNTTPSLNEDNENAMSKAIDDIDNRVIALAGTIMEDVPQIQEDLEILEPAIENIDSNVERAETAADDAEDSAETAEYWANVSNPPIPVTKDFASVISVDDAIPKAATDVKVKVEAVQDLHGYTKPWVGGAGKNKLPTVISEIKAANTSGTWSGNVFTHVNGVKTTILTDSDNNVIGFNINGTSNGVYEFRFTAQNLSLPAGSYIYSIQNNINIDNVWVSLYNPNAVGIITKTATSANYTCNGSFGGAYIYSNSGNTFNNVVVKPMLRLASVSDASYEPYENKCPISGFTEAKLTRTGKNVFPIKLSEMKSRYATGWSGDALTRSGVTYNFITNGDYITEIRTSGTATGSGDSDIFIIDGIPTFLKDNVNYILTGCPAGGSDSTYLVQYNNWTEGATYIKYDYGEGFTFQKITDSTTQKMRIWIKNGANADGLVFKPMIRLATETDATFAPYTGTDYIIDLDGTRYGATLDVTSGVMTVNKGFVILDGSDDENWGLGGGGKRVNTEAVAGLVKTVPSTEVADIISSQYEKKTANQTYTGVMGISVDDTYGNLGICDGTGSMNLANWKAYLASNPMEVCYTLKNPITVNLTPTEVQMLQGYNVLSANSGDVYLKYDASMIQRIANEKLDISTFKSVVASSSDFADFKTKVAAL